MGSAHASGTLDQQFVPVILGSSAGIDADNPVAQVVTPGISGALTTVDLLLSRDNAVRADLSLGIYRTTGGLPTGTALATSVKTYGQIDPGRAWVTFNFLDAPLVSAGTQFALVLSTAEAPGNTYLWAVQGTANAYSGGAASWNYLNSGWTFGNFTTAFRTYVTMANSGATPPPVIQQFGMPSSGTCDADALIVLNWGGAGSGGWGNSWAQWANGGKGGPVCTRTLVYSNVLSHWIVG